MTEGDGGFVRVSVKTGEGLKALGERMREEVERRFVGFILFVSFVSDSGKEELMKDDALEQVQLVG
jgi:hypothetical protein